MEKKDQKAALLVMDMQVSILSRLSNPTELVTKLEKAISLARTKSIPVIYVVVGFRMGAPEISDSNKSFSVARERWANKDPQEMMKIHPGLSPLADDIIVTKRRISAFAGSDLEIVLRASGIDHMILTGFATSGVVLSTLREAADKDYRLTVLSDCCADMDEEVHRVLTTKVFPRQADVISLDEWGEGKVEN